MLQDVAQLPYNVATGIVETVASEVEDMVPGDGHPSPDVDSNQIYHETAAQMREAHQDEMERTPRSGTPDLVHAVPGREDDLQGTATYPSSEEALDQDRPVSAAAAVHAAMEENSVLPSADRTPSAVAGPAASDAKVTEHGTSPRRSVTIQDTAEVIGEASPDEEAPQSPSAATDSTSDSSGVADLSGSGAHSYLHYRIGKDVILRLEFISPEDTRVSTCTCLHSIGMKSFCAMPPFRFIFPFNFNA